MNITFDLSPAVHKHGGIGRYAHELLTALTAVDHTNRYRTFYISSPHVRPDTPLDQLPAQRLSLNAKQWRLAVILATLGGITLDRWLPSGDIFHATDNVLPPIRHAAAVFTVYDMTPLLFPEYHLPLNRWHLKLMLPRYLQRSHAIIAISEHTQRDLARLVPGIADKITVIRLGVDPAYRPIDDPLEAARVRRKYNLPAQFLLYVGTIEPRKNLSALLNAYSALRSRHAQVPDLVLAGRKGWLHAPVFQQIRDLGLDHVVHYLDWVEEKDLPVLMNAATVFVYPSLYEGFGLPPLEAMACGTPVVCSNASSLPEVVGTGGLLIEPSDVSALTQALERVLADECLRRDLRARGLEQAARFSWERAARETLAVYERAKAHHAHRD